MVSEVTHKSDALCILVVEDDPMVRLFIVGYLRDQGYAVVETDTGEEALALLHVERQPPIRVVFTDFSSAESSMVGTSLRRSAKPTRTFV